MESVHSSSDSITVKASNLDKSAPRRVTLSPVYESKTSIQRNQANEQQRTNDVLDTFVSDVGIRLRENIHRLTQGVASGRFQREEFAMMIQVALINAVPDSADRVNQLFDAMLESGGNITAQTEGTIINMTTSNVSSSLTTGTMASNFTMGGDNDLIHHDGPAHEAAGDNSAALSDMDISGTTGSSGANPHSHW